MCKVIAHDPWTRSRSRHIRLCISTHALMHVYQDMYKYVFVQMTNQNARGHTCATTQVSRTTRTPTHASWSCCAYIPNVCCGWAHTCMCTWHTQSLELHGFIHIQAYNEYMNVWAQSCHTAHIRILYCKTTHLLCCHWLTNMNMPSCVYIPFYT